MAMPESVPAPLIIDTYKDVFRAERRGQRRQEPLGWIISVPDTHQKSVLAALDKERDVSVLTCSTEDEANGVAAHLGDGPQDLFGLHAVHQIVSRPTRTTVGPLRSRLSR